MSDETNPVDPKNFGELYKTNSVFMNINIAGLRCAQLRRGAHSRLTGGSLKRKSTSIAIEEVKQGLVGFNYVEKFIV